MKEIGLAVFVGLQRLEIVPGDWPEADLRPRVREAMVGVVDQRDCYLNAVGCGLLHQPHHLGRPPPEQPPAKSSGMPTINRAAWSAQCHKTLLYPSLLSGRLQGGTVLFRMREGSIKRLEP